MRIRLLYMLDFLNCSSFFVCFIYIFYHLWNFYILNYFVVEL
jgi:hypothetical protein